MAEDLDWVRLQIGMRLQLGVLRDVKFLVGSPSKTIYGHKCILAARCEVFKKMFDEEKDGPLELADMTVETFLTLVEFIYTNCCTLNGQNVMEVMLASMEYGLDQLMKVCEKFLSENVNVNTACEAMQACVTFGLDSLKDQLLPFFEDYTLDIFNSKSFNEMSDEALAFILQSDNLDIDEYDLLLAVRSWATVNAVVLGRSIQDVAQGVVRHIRLSLLTSEELSRIETDNFKDHLIPVEEISKAWRNLALKTVPGSTIDTTARRGTKLRKRDR